MREYCVDLEIAKELKENGFPQTSIYNWFWDNCNEDYFVQIKALDEEDTLICSAPNSDEILRELPEEVRGFKFRIEKTNNIWEVNYYIWEEAPGLMEEVSLGRELCEDKKLSNALAKMWLYLKKEGYINA